VKGTWLLPNTFTKERIKRDLPLRSVAPTSMSAPITQFKDIGREWDVESQYACYVGKYCAGRIGRFSEIDNHP